MTALSTTPNTTAEVKPASLRDHKPRVQRNTTNGLSQAEKVRDEIHDMIKSAARQMRVDVLIATSDPFTSLPQVVVECWVRHGRDPAVSLRSTASLRIRPREFHLFPYECDITFCNQKETIIRNVIAFYPADAKRLLSYLLSTTVTRPPRFRRCRTWRVDLWRPKNKPARLGNDPRAVTVIILAILGFATLSFGVGFLFLLGAGVLGHFNARRRTHVLSAGKPTQEPRKLIRLDSWQVVVDGLGPLLETVRSDITREIAAIPGQDFEVSHEQIWYWGGDEKEERKQTVIRLRRGLLFLHLYAYGDNLFVGWDAHVNCGKWSETIAGKGYDKDTGELCAVHSIRDTWHIPNEYDITDTNCLIEQVHAVITRCVKLKVAEFKIDQEIDFKIVREPRQGIAGRADPSQDSTLSSFRAKFRRLA